MDLIVGAWSGVRRGATIGRQQIEQVRERAAEELEELGAQAPLSAESREAYAARRQAEAAAEAETETDRKDRLDDRLKDY
jgi:hypothetical protein